METICRLPAQPLNTHALIIPRFQLGKRCRKRLLFTASIKHDASGSRALDVLPIHSRDPGEANLCRRALLMAASAVLAGVGSALPSNAEPEALQQGQPITKVFVAGATGQTGRRVVRQLRQRGYTVVAGVRSLEKAAALGFDQDSGIEIRRADVTEGVEALRVAIGDCQAVVSALGFNGGNDPKGFVDVDSKGTIDLIAAAQAAGSVRRFVLETSALTSADSAGSLVGRLAYSALNYGTGVLDRKKEAEAALVQAAASSRGATGSGGGGLEYTIVRPSGLSNDPPEQVGVPVYGPANSVLGPSRVSRDSVAELMAEAVGQPSAANRLVEITSSPNAQPVPPGPMWFP